MNRPELPARRATVHVGGEAVLPEQVADAGLAGTPPACSAAARHARASRTGPDPQAAPPLADIAFAALAEGCEPDTCTEARWLATVAARVDARVDACMPTRADSCPAIDHDARADARSAPGAAPAVDAFTTAHARGDARLRRALAHWQGHAPAADRLLQALARTQRFGAAETLAVALACAAELDPMAARTLAWLQQPVGTAAPTLGLLATAAAQLGEPDALVQAADGRASRLGILQLPGDERPLCERGVRVPLPLVLALAGGEGHWDGISTDANDLPPLPASVRAQARAHAAGLGGERQALVLRSAQPAEARAAACAIAAALGRRAAFIDIDPPPGCGAWLALRALVPVLCRTLAPGERHRLPRLAGYDGPLLVATGPDGALATGDEPTRALGEWRLPVPTPPERAALWRRALGEAAAALAPAALADFATAHRHGAGRIAELAQAARAHAARAQSAAARAAGVGADSADLARHAVTCDRGTAAQAASARAVAPDAGDADRAATARVAPATPGPSPLADAVRAGVGADLGALAERLADDIPDDALVLAPDLRDALDALLARCRTRDGLDDGLGAATRARYRPGVRALLVGASGTGKTLAAGWIATRLGVPLYRVDLAAVTSKYIGETEKNLAELFARAEHAEVVLLFDEADALFGKRTDIKDANDRFANQQTNYLLQRIESFDGIVVLTSNSRSRFDAAFTRRLDAIIDFAAPGPAERRALWLAHLGAAHALDAAVLNRLAAACELAGGHIRNAVLAAAAQARAHGRTFDAVDLFAAVGAEYRKLGRQPPAELRAGHRH